jgi:6-phosphogluconolactonase (cycloisomerase 2 family)
MKFGIVGTIGRVTLVAAIALALATAFTACGTLNVGFLFVATNKQTPGQIEVYEVDSESGSLRTIPTSPFPSGGRNPIAEAVSPDSKNLYVVNEDDNNIVQFGIGTDGKLYPQSTVNTPGSFPLAVAVNSAGTLLYVVDTLQPIAGCSLTNPCPGDIAVFPIDPKTGALGAAVTNNSQYPNYWPLLVTPSNATTVLTPTAVQVLANGNDVYVGAYNPNTKAGYLFGFSTGSGGTLTPLNGGMPLSSGAQPAALISDSASAYLYVADQIQNKISGYSVQPTGSLTLVSTSATGGLPSALTLDSDKFLYVTNSGDSTVTGYVASAGSLTKISTNASDTQPIAITVDPRHLGFLYTVNFLGNSLSGYQIDPNSGTLINTKRTPYLSTVQPTAIAGIPHGGTATK